MSGNKTLTADLMRKALGLLDDVLARELTTRAILVVGGGTAMVLAHEFPLGTTDVDAISKGVDVDQLDRAAKQVATELDLAPDWLNPYYGTFSHTLPGDYKNRLIEIFSGQCIQALALGKEEMLIMKCFARRQKDVPHAKALIKLKADLDFVENHIELLNKKGIPGAREALDFLDDLRDQVNQ